MTDSAETVLLSLTFTEPVVENKHDEVEGEIVDMGNGQMGFRIFGNPFSCQNLPKTDTLNFNLNDTETLYVIDALINCKKVKRRELIQDLKNLGYEL